MSYDSAISEIIPDAPLRWKLDEPSGATTAANSGTAGTSGDMTASSSAMSGQDGLLTVGTSYKVIDTLGNQTYLSSTTAGAEIDGLESLAVALWFLPDALVGNDFLIDSTDGTVNNGLSIRKASSPSGAIVVGITTSTGGCMASTPAGTIAASGTYLVVLTWQSGSDVKVYVNGVEQTLNVTRGTIDPGGALVNADALYLGRWKSQVDSNLGGFLDDVTVGAAYLTEDQALALYTAGAVVGGAISTSGTSALSSSGTKAASGTVMLAGTGAAVTTGGGEIRRTSISEIRAELANAVRDPIVPGLNALAYTPDAVPDPCFYAGEVEIDPNFVYGGGYDVTVTCRVLVSRGDDRSGQALLDEYLSQGGAKSIINALRDARGAPGTKALNGQADDLNVVSVSGYRMYQVGEVQFFGAELRVRVIGI